MIPDHAQRQPSQISASCFPTYDSIINTINPASTQQDLTHNAACADGIAPGAIQNMRMISPFDLDIAKHLPKNLEFSRIQPENMTSSKYHISKKPPTTVDTKTVDRMLQLVPGTCYVLSDWMRIKGIIEIHNEWDRVLKNKKSPYRSLQSKLKSTFEEMLYAFENIYAAYLQQCAIQNTTVCKNRIKRVEKKHSRAAHRSPPTSVTAEDHEETAREPDQAQAETRKRRSTTRNTDTPRTKRANTTTCCQNQPEKCAHVCPAKKRHIQEPAQAPVYAMGTVMGTRGDNITASHNDNTQPREEPNTQNLKQQAAHGQATTTFNPNQTIPELHTSNFAPAYPPPPPHVYGYPCLCPNCLNVGYMVGNVQTPQKHARDYSTNPTMSGAHTTNSEVACTNNDPHTPRSAQECDFTLDTATLDMLLNVTVVSPVCK